MFTKLGRILAVLTILFGILKIIMAVTVLQHDNPAGAARAILGSKSTGHYIDLGSYMIAFGIVLGVLTDISKSLMLFRAANLKDDTE